MVLRLRDFAQPRTRMVLTSRAHFFTSAWQAQELFATNLQPEMDGRRPAFEVMYLSAGLSGLTTDQIKFIASRRLGKNYKNFIKFAESVYDLSDLMRRPLLLSMALDIARDIEIRGKYNVYDLYESYTGQWLMRWEAAKHLSRNRLAALGWKMFSEDRILLPREELREFLRRLFPSWRGEQFDELDSEIRTASFLVRDAAGNYGFAHKSFQEFFCAKYILQTLSHHDPACLAFGREGPNVFSDGIDEFMRTGISDSVQEYLRSLAGSKTANQKVAGRLLQVIDSRTPNESV